PDRGGGEVLVEAGAEDDVVLLELRRGAPELDVVAPQRRAAIAGNVAAGVEARRGVPQALLNRQAHQRLHAGQVDPALGRRVAGVESGLRPGEGDGHENNPLRVARPLCAASRLAAALSEVTRERIVEFRKVAPNDADVERAQDRLLGLAVEKEPHRGLDATRRLGAELSPAVGLVGLDRDPMPAFAAPVARHDVEGQRAGRIGRDGYCGVAHRCDVYRANSPFSKPFRMTARPIRAGTGFHLARLLDAGMKRYGDKENEQRSGHTANTVSPRILLTCGERCEEM